MALTGDLVAARRDVDADLVGIVVDQVEAGLDGHRIVGGAVTDGA